MARTFDPTGSIGQLANLTSPVTAPPFTLFCRFRISSLANGTMVCVAESTTDTNYTLLRQLNTGAVSLQVNAITPDTISTTVLATDINCQWHTGAAVLRTVSDRSVYLDGGNRVDSAVSKSPTTPTLVAIGSRRGATAAAGGTPNSIADVCIFDIDLTDGEVKALHNGASPFTVRSGHLVGFWPLHADSSYQRDFSRGGRHLTTTSGTHYMGPNPPTKRSKQRIARFARLAATTLPPLPIVVDTAVMQAANY